MKPPAVTEASARVASADPETLTYGTAVALGILQGATEFLPISSSGHLALAETLITSRQESVAFDLLLHVATVLVVIKAYGRDLLSYWREQRSVFAYLAVGTVPAVCVGLLFHKQLEAIRSEPLLVCAALLVTAASLAAAETIRVPASALNRLGYGRSLVIGLCQALAIVPGISRSGSTIAGGMLSGLAREDAVKFSFLLMIPVVLGASVYKFLRDPGELDALPFGPCLAGFLAALVVGYLALWFLLHLVRRRSLLCFAAYCTFIALTGFIYFGLVV